MNRDDFIDKILGGIFAVVAIVAAIIELVLGDISTASVAACIKDVFSTLAVVVLFFAVIKDKIPAKNFRTAFDNAMLDVSAKYSPLIRKEVISDSTEETAASLAKKKKLDAVICYDMASNLNVIFGASCNDYPRFLEIHNNVTTTVKFLIIKKFFDSSEFTESTLVDVANKIKTNLSIKFADYSFSVDEKKTEINVNTGRLMSSKKDALELANLIDNAVMLYIAESKK